MIRDLIMEHLLQGRFHSMDPRHIEAWLSLSIIDLEQLTPTEFAIEMNNCLRLAIAFPDRSEELAQELNIW